MYLSVLLFMLGVSLGSFVNALVWRVFKQSQPKSLTKRLLKKLPLKANKEDYSILKGRSMCVECRHTLYAADLVPIFSWLWLRGRCRYCHKPISWQYPVVELATGLVFVVSYYFWPVELAGGQWLLFVAWLAGSVGLMALAVYDLRWMLLPNRILYPAFWAVLVGRLGYLAAYSHNPLRQLVSLVLSIAVASGIFWVLFYVSRGTWIGYGDVRLGLVTGTVLAKPSLSLLMIFVASLLGCLAVLPQLLSGDKTTASKIPFGPFLIAGCFIVLLFGDALLHWYQRLILV